MKTQIIPHKYQFKRGKSGAFDGSTLLLEAGEPFIEYREDKTIVGMKIGDGVNYYDNLPFLDENTRKYLSELIEEVKILRNQVSDAGDSTYFVTEEDWNIYPSADLEERINYFLNSRYNTVTPTEGNLFVVKGAISNAQNSYQVFVRTTDKWEQIVGKTFTVNDIVFTDNITFTEAVGSLEVPKTGHGTLRCKGKTLSQFFTELLCKTRLPKITYPKVDFNVTGFKNAEVGESLTFGYSFSHDEGSYEFGPATGAELTNIEVTLKRLTKDGRTETSTKTTQTGSFEVTLVEGDVYTISAQCEVMMTNVPNDNMGQPTHIPSNKQYSFNPNKKAEAYSPVTYFSGWRNASGVLDIDSMSGQQLAQSLTSDFIRPDSIHCEKMKQIIVAVPDTEDVTVVTFIQGGIGQRCSDFVTKTIPVNSKNITYRVFCLINDNADKGDNTYKIEYS